ncbi:class I SAM-dependent methyltransferase [Candidatus Woesearchaeota archaeon]|jgi:SAM-dependent methyltransferase|nr:class I SAM-dependent methyltransferase [Candidatus Woesearchaeota archaeon]MBT6518245.1 class I SAM-dependent methyltransferase [Candidatus Woesearchaeota archaeon]MBT7367473.1 class I SAM-dependent methyltransferase [Candidatus Woesearchaeota archaeon]
MEPKKDAYGQEVWAFFQGKKSYEVIERDDGYIDFSGGAPTYFAEFKDWPKIQKQAIKYAKGKVLDVGAGAGRVSLYLQKKKIDVVAIDNSPLAIKVCKKRGVKHAKVLPIEKIGSFKPNSFDTILMFGNNFGLFGGFKKAKTLLKKFHKITNPHALIITENVDPFKTEDPVHLSYHKFNKKRGRMPGQLRIRIRFRNYIGDWFDYLIVSKKEMKEILKDTGWKVKKFIDAGDHIYSAIIEKE